jgi:hypothetical protein
MNHKEIFDNINPICELEEENVIEETEPQDIDESNEQENIEWMDASRNISLMSSQILDKNKQQFHKIELKYYKPQNVPTQGPILTGGEDLCDFDNDLLNMAQMEFI